MIKITLLLALLAVAQAQQTFTRTVTTRTEEQPLSVQVLPQTQTIRTVSTGAAAQPITLQGLQGIQGLQGAQIQTIDAETLRRLNLQGQGVRIIQIPVGGVQTAGIQTATLNQGATLGIVGGGSQGITRTQVLTTRTDSEAAIAAAPVPAPPPPSTRARVVNTVVTNDVEGDAAEPAPEPYSFSYVADTEDGASSERQETQDAQGRVTGFYTILLADGSKRRVDYVADENGYRATISTNEFGTQSSNPADVVIDSSQPSPSELSKQWTEEQERTGARQKAAPPPPPANQQQAIFRTQTSSTRTVSRAGGNFEFIGPEAIQDTGARTATVTVTQEQPQSEQFVVVRVPAGQVPAGAVPVGQFVGNRQASASERRPIFSGFGSRQRQAAASARQGIKI